MQYEAVIGRAAAQAAHAMTMPPLDRQAILEAAFVQTLKDEAAESGEPFDDEVAGDFAASVFARMNEVPPAPAPAEVKLLQTLDVISANLGSIAASLAALVGLTAKQRPNPETVLTMARAFLRARREIMPDDEELQPVGAGEDTDPEVQPEAADPGDSPALD